MIGAQRLTHADDFTDAVPFAFFHQAPVVSCRTDSRINVMTAAIMPNKSWPQPIRLPDPDPSLLAAALNQRFVKAGTVEFKRTTAITRSI